MIHRHIMLVGSGTDNYPLCRQDPYLGVFCLMPILWKNGRHPSYPRLSAVALSIRY
jgi:hypothetical protein